jgi:hypothetical protein
MWPLRQISRHRRAWQRLVSVPLLLCALLTTGCTTAFFYNRLDTFAGWYFESLVSLNDIQRTELRGWLERTLAWHRRSELSRYASFVSDLSATVEKPGTQESYDDVRRRFQGLVDDLIEKTAPEASELLTRLSPAQVEELLDNLAEKTRESTEESAEAVAENEWRPEQAKSIARQVKRWTGSITPDQKQLIAIHIAQIEPTYAEWAESQAAWRDALRDALLTPASEESDAASQRVLGLLEDPNEQWTREYSAKVDRNRARYQQMLMELDASLSPRQREHLRAELLKLSRQLTRLAQI